MHETIPPHHGPNPGAVQGSVEVQIYHLSYLRSILFTQSGRGVMVDFSPPKQLSACPRRCSTINTYISTVDRKSFLRGIKIPYRSLYDRDLPELFCRSPWPDYKFLSAENCKFLAFWRKEHRFAAATKSQTQPAAPSLPASSTATRLPGQNHFQPHGHSRKHPANTEPNQRRPGMIGRSPSPRHTNRSLSSCKAALQSFILRHTHRSKPVSYLVGRDGFFQYGNACGIMGAPCRH